MSTVAFVLMNVDLGKEKQVLSELKRIQEVKQAYEVYGVYDMMVKIEAENEQDVKDIVFSRIRRLGEVRSTLTLTTASSGSGGKE